MDEKNWTCEETPKSKFLILWEKGSILMDEKNWTYEETPKSKFLILWGKGSTFMDEKVGLCKPTHSASSPT